jgi:uncharacterized protein YecT (DUF1311 family)
VDLISMIKEATKEIQFNILDDSLFDKTILAWQDYRKVKAEIDASYFEGGSIQPLIYFSSLRITTQEKIQSLRNEYNIDLKRFNTTNKNTTR